MNGSTALDDDLEDGGCPRAEEAPAPSQGAGRCPAWCGRAPAAAKGRLPAQRSARSSTEGTGSGPLRACGPVSERPQTWATRRATFPRRRAAPLPVAGNGYELGALVGQLAACAQQYPSAVLTVHVDGWCIDLRRELGD